MKPSNATTLPDVEKTPLLLLRFSPKASQRLIELVKERLQQGGLLILSSSQRTARRTILSLTATQKRLEEQAEIIRLRKFRPDVKIIDYFTVERKQQFYDKAKGCRDAEGLFTASEWNLLIRRILDSIEVLLPNEKESPLSRILDDYHADYHSKLEAEESLTSTESRRMRLEEHGSHSACLRHVLQTYRLVDAVTPVHLPSLSRELTRETFWPSWRLGPPVAEIQDYYGWEVAFYFAFMNFLTQWLIFPGILGLIVFLLRWYRQDTIDEDEYTPFYGLITFLWAVLMIRFWDRQEHRLSYHWGTHSLALFERQKFLDTRPEFRGYLRESPATGEIETYYPPMRRRLKYLVSSIVTIAMLVVAFVVMICSLNAQGYIRPKSSPNRWNDNNPHPFHVRRLAVLAEKDQLFDATSTWKCYIPVILHVACIFTLNSIYRMMARKLTSFENHETEVNHRNSLVLKRFLFEAFDSYIALFYLAFYERDVERLRLELVAVFQIDTMRRILMECIVPMLLQRLTFLRSVGAKHWETDVNNTKMENVFDEVSRDTYEQFDDHMEIVIQIGYITLFASAFPLASLIAIVANWIEVRTDAFKLATVCRRPFCFRATGLGMWKTLTACIIWMSALTNCLIAGFTSDQLMHYLPSFYVQDESGYSDMGHDKGWILVFVIFGLERLLLIAGLLIWAIIPAVPEDVMNEFERRQFIRRKEQEGKLQHRKTD